MLAQRAQEYLQTEDAKQESIYPVQKAVGHTHIVVLVCAGTRRQPLGRLSLQFKARLVSIMPLSSRMAALQQRKQVLATLKAVGRNSSSHNVQVQTQQSAAVKASVAKQPSPSKTAAGKAGASSTCKADVRKALLGSQAAAGSRSMQQANLNFTRQKLQLQQQYAQQQHRAEKAMRVATAALQPGSGAAGVSPGSSANVLQSRHQHKPMHELFTVWHSQAFYAAM